MIEGQVVSDWVAAASVAFGLVFGTAGWQRGETVRRRRKAAGIPTVDTAHMRLHDCFNLLTLPVIIVMGACVMFDYLGLPSGQQVGLPVDAHVYTLIFSLYVAVDLVYVWAIPESTPQPGVILVHHVVTLMMVRFPLLDARLAPSAACISIVEFNTLILVAQRHFAPWLLGTSLAATVLRPVIFCLYWSTYLAIRFGLHPYMAYLIPTTLPMGVYDTVLVASLLALLCVFNAVLFGKQLMDIWSGVALPGSPRKATGAETGQKR